MVVDHWDVLAVIGAALILLGLGLYSIPACFFISGVFILGFSLWASKKWASFNTSGPDDPQKTQASH